MGLLLPVALGIAAYIVSRFYPALDALFLALIFGIFFGGVVGKGNVEKIAEKSLSITLPVGIVLYGANVKFPNFYEISLPILILTFISALFMGLSVFVIAKRLGVGGKLPVLLACGTAICGASAIAIVSSILKPSKEEFSTAVIVITIVGLTGAAVYPALHGFLTKDDFATVCGATLHQTGLVKIASKDFGSDVLQKALTVKSIRIALIAVVALLVSLIYAEHRFYVPGYIVGFLIMSFMSSTYLGGWSDWIEPVSTIAFSTTLASIGLCVSRQDIQRARLSPLVASYIGWFFTSATIIAILRWLI
ncbi:YeiH family protein [Archaeoglobus veneficus]|uniref:Uncharacterized protein family UPF0324 n=1 Tax=Archaeoglobus veneficus (strain DSM 11195 / SNP6) TaxID=693661 RepID=F2KMI7_ARCVS|nr:putative sulfate exporter family transporter [Archaeoglobus veneficus]AEA47184.1 Uncharacterized protein family UPF0324 [Archaeoglobus veneficus SNP6]